MWILCKISIMPTVCKNLFVVDNCFNSWDPKIHSPRNYPQSFMWMLLLMNAVPQSIIHLKCFGMVSQKRKDHLLKA